MDTGSKISFPFHDYIFDRIIRIPGDDNNFQLLSRNFPGRSYKRYTNSTRVHAHVRGKSSRAAKHTLRTQRTSLWWWWWYLHEL